MTQHPCQLEDDKLLAECRVETYRASGPGGQKRNKTSSAIRITHLPTGVSATAADSRSQHDNRKRGLDRLRLQLALEVRRELTGKQACPAWWPEVVDRAGRVHVSRRAMLYVPTVALVFDYLEDNHGSLADAAEGLKTSTANLVDLLASDDLVWGATQRLRLRHGHRTLLNPRKS